MIFALILRFFLFEAYESAASLAETRVLLVATMKPHLVHVLGLKAQIAAANEPPKEFKLIELLISNIVVLAVVSVLLIALWKAFR